MAVYVHAKLPRAGLANMLVPWARAEVFRARYGVPMLAPQWTKVKLGPILRGERDKRYYMGLFSAKGYVRGPAKWLAQWRGRVVKGDEADAFMASGGAGRGGAWIVQYEGYEHWFRGIAEHRALIARRLVEMLRPDVRERLEKAPSPVIAVHARRGDMPVIKPGEEVGDRWLAAMPDEWFIGAIRAAREAAGWQAPVTLFSDGHNEQLARIMEVGNIRRAADNPSVVDMLLLSRSRVLITTGTSSFSGWGAFLGQPRIASLWYPGLRLRLLEHTDVSRALATDMSGGLDREGAACVRAALEGVPRDGSTW